MVVAVAGMSEVAFRSERPLVYLAFPALGWARLRSGHPGATLAIAVAVGFAVWNTTHYHGPLLVDSVTLSVLTGPALHRRGGAVDAPLAAVVFERRRFAERLNASRTRLVNASDTERRRLEHNLHDGAQQRLTALAIRLGVAADRARDAHDAEAPTLEAAGTEVTLAIDELRELARGIHPAVLTDHGLASAMRAVAARSTVHVAFVQLPSTRSDDSVEATAYYVFAEALTNAQKHALASSVRVRVIATTHTLRLEIVDDGIGGASERAGRGLIGLRDRVEALGGTFDINSPSGHGTRIAATIPATPAAS